MNRVLVFSHANGFPAGTYGTLFAAWAQAGWRVLALDRFGHDPAYPVTSNWRPTRDELIAFIERSGADGPVHLVGHSLGGYLSLLVACNATAPTAAAPAAARNGLSRYRVRPGSAAAGGRDDLRSACWVARRKISASSKRRATWG